MIISKYSINTDHYSDEKDGMRQKNGLKAHQLILIRLMMPLNLQNHLKTVKNRKMLFGMPNAGVTGAELAERPR